MRIRTVRRRELRASPTEAEKAGGNLLGRFTGDSNSRSFVPFNGRILAEYYCGGVIFDQPDEIGSATTATDCTGSIVNEKLYYPFGEFWTGYAIPNLGMHQEFAQLPDYDSETDQYNTANRHYTPMGRWLSPDPGGLKAVHPEDPQSWNMYAYVRNNPTTLTDPNGEDWATAWQDLKAALGTIYARASIGVGFGGSRTLYGLKGEAELAAKANLKFSGKEGKLSLTKSTEAALTLGPKSSKVGVGGAIDNTVVSYSIETKEFAGPEPPHADLTEGIGTEHFGTDPTSNELGVGGEGGEILLAGGEIGLTREGWSSLGSAFFDVADQFLVPPPPTPPPPCTLEGATNCGNSATPNSGNGPHN